MSSYLIHDYASLLEYRLSEDLNKSPTELLYKANIIINPSSRALCNRTIIINLATDSPLEDLVETNHIFSRFQIGYNIPCIPFEIKDEDRKSKSIEEYSLLILTKWAVKDKSLTKKIDETNYLLATDVSIDNNITAVGYKLLSTKIEDLK